MSLELNGKHQVLVCRLSLWTDGCGTGAGGHAW